MDLDYKHKNYSLRYVNPDPVFVGTVPTVVSADPVVQGSVNCLDERVSYKGYIIFFFMVILIIGGAILLSKYIHRENYDITDYGDRYKLGYADSNILEPDITQFEEEDEEEDEE